MVHAEKRKIESELMKGKAMTVRLQALLAKPIKDRGPVSAHDLAHKIYRSFAHSLSVLDSWDGSTLPAQISSAADSADSKVKNRRGCYTRRRPVESWTTYFQVEEDGYAWRKYGQKDIMDSPYPRCYYRCTYKSQGCQAKKQVQRIQAQQQPIMYQTTYFSNHSLSCPNHTQTRVIEPRPTTNIISFQMDDQKPTIGSVVITADNNSSAAEDIKPSLLDACSDFVVSDCFGNIENNKHVGDPQEEAGASCTGSTSFDDDDVDFYNQLADIGPFPLC